MATGNNKTSRSGNTRSEKKRKPKRKQQGERRAFPRPFWSGTISFGLVSVPVDLFPASRNISARLRMLDRDRTPLSRRYHCPEDDIDVHPEHILRGYEVSDGEYVIVRDDELESLRPRQSRDIDLRRFVPRDRIPPLFFERAYFLTPSGDSTKAYRLLAEVIERTDRAGIGTFVMRDKEYLAAILAEKGILRAEVLRYEDEVRTPEDIGLSQEGPPDSKRVTELRKVIRSLAADRIDPDEMRTGYLKNLQQLAEKKLKRKTDVVETAEFEDEEDGNEPQVDLLEAIRRSLQARKTSASGNGRQSPDTGNAAESETREQLYERAQRLDIPGRSKMSKQQLIQALRNRT